MGEVWHKPVAGSSIEVQITKHEIEVKHGNTG